MIRQLTRLLTCCALVLLLGCSNRPLHVGAIQIGRSLNADNTVGRFTTTFKPNDTIYVSVLTTDRGSGTISVKWSYNGRQLSERSTAVSFTMAGATQFHLDNPTGFPAGPYSVEVLLDGTSVGSRTFTVEQ